MTAKHKHEEYVAQKEFEETFWFLVILVLVVLVASVVLSWANRPTLTQLAEAEGWEIVCEDYDDEYTIDSSLIPCAEGYETWWKTIDNCDKTGYITLKHCRRCTTGTLRRHE